VITVFMAALAADPWAATIDGVLGSVVIIEMDRTRPFDGNPQSSSEASGFVIDAARGLVLTNRHVITHGPTRARAIFTNKEEVDLVPVYADPVHDFGVFRYDPDDLRYSDPVSLSLAPEGARVGGEIKVIGNDAAEQLSILGGTISRIDRDAPHWDFNTFYLQAASSTSGGSSGSPVFDVDGRVVALNAGARNDAATSLFLPLDRVVVAVEALQEGRTPSRGTVQAVLRHATFEEARRLGLDDAREAARRARTDATGILAVGRVNPGGPAEGRLEEGDLVLTLQGEPVDGFVPWEAVLDDRVGEKVTVGVLRRGEPVEVELEVQDLHTLTPSAYLEIGEGVLHPFGYHAAVRVPRPVEGVAVARAGRLFASGGIGGDALIHGIADADVRTLDDAVAALAAIPEGEAFQVRWTPKDEPKRPRVSTVRMSRELWPVQTCVRADEGRWPCTPVEVTAAPAETEPVVPRLHTVDRKRHRAAAAALVEVTFRPLLNLDSALGDQRTSPGWLLDAEGLVLTDRNAVPTTAGQVRVRVGDAPSVPATIEHVDPLHNVALVRLDPDAITLPPFEPPVFRDVPLAVGDEYTLVALDRQGSVYTQSVDLDRIVNAGFGGPRYPRFVERDIDFVRIGKLDRPSLGGALVDRKGRIVALVQPYPKAGRSHGTSLNTAPVHVALQAMARRGTTAAPTLGLDLWTRPLVEAREAGLPTDVAETLREAAPDRPQVIEVSRVSGESPARGVVEVGDWIVAIDGHTVTDFQGLEDRVTAGPMTLTVVRRGTVRDEVVQPLMLPIDGTRRAVLWAGMIVQDEHPEVALYSQTPREGVYISWFYGGSPAQRYHTGYGRRIVAIDGTPVSDLDAFLAAVADRPDRSSVRLQLQGLDGDSWVTTLELDQEFWPTTLFERTPDGWTRTVLE
jgi:S1-C subfamily serine protease